MGIRRLAPGQVNFLKDPQRARQKSFAVRSMLAGLRRRARIGEAEYPGRHPENRNWDELRELADTLVRV